MRFTSLLNLFLLLSQNVAKPTVSSPDTTEGLADQLANRMFERALKVQKFAASLVHSLAGRCDRMHGDAPRSRIINNAVSPRGEMSMRATVQKSADALRSSEVDKTGVDKQLITSLPTVILPVKDERQLFRLSAEQNDVINDLDGWADKELLPLLKPINSSWQPQDFLPEPSKGDWLEQVADIQKRAKDIPDAVLVALVGDMITEEALPTYQTMLNTLDGTRDETGADERAWAKWTRAWTAEENRHGDLLNKYLWMTGRINMRAVEKTIQHLIGSGMDPKTDKNPYLGYIYTSFQERATKISHQRTATLAQEAGDPNLAKICRSIAGDEGRHEIAYQKVVEKLFAVDPEGTIKAYEDMMKKKIVMPAHLMFDGENDNLWNEFSGVAEDLGVYTAKDYIDIMEALNKRWKIKDMHFTGDAAKSQEYVLSLPIRMRRLADRAAKRAKSKSRKEARISWIFNRPLHY